MTGESKFYESLGKLSEIARQQGLTNEFEEFKETIQKLISLLDEGYGTITLGMQDWKHRIGWDE